MTDLMIRTGQEILDKATPERDSGKQPHSLYLCYKDSCDVGLYIWDRHASNEYKREVLNDLLNVVQGLFKEIPNEL